MSRVHLSKQASRVVAVLHDAAASGTDAAAASQAVRDVIASVRKLPTPRVALRLLSTRCLALRSSAPRENPW